MDELKAKITAAFEDKEFVEKLSAAEAPADAQKVFLEKGIELSIDDIVRIGNTLSGIENGEISELDLDEVVGGSAAAVIGLVVACCKLAYEIRKIHRTW